MFMQRIFRCGFLVGVLCLLLVHGLQVGGDGEEEDTKPLISLLKSSADRVIANAPVIINRDSELYQRYWKQRLPRRVTLKQNLEQSSDEENQKVQNEIVVLEKNIPEEFSQGTFSHRTRDIGLVHIVPQHGSFQLDPETKYETESLESSDHEAQPSDVEQSVVRHYQNHVSVSRDEPVESLADQLAELEVKDETVANVKDFLPAGDFLKIQDDNSRGSSDILIRIKEQRKLKLPPAARQPKKSSVRQLAGQFIQSSKPRSLPPSRFDSNFFDQPSLKREIPSQDQSTKTVYSRDVTQFRNTDEPLFRHQVESRPFDNTTPAQKNPPAETAVTPPTNTQPTFLSTEAVPTNLPSAALHGSFSQRPFEPVFDTVVTASDGYQLPVTESAVQIQPYPVSHTSSYESSEASSETYSSPVVAPIPKDETYGSPGRPAYQVYEVDSYSAPLKETFGISYDSPVTQSSSTLSPPAVQSYSSIINASPQNSYGSPNTGYHQIELTTPHPLEYGFQPVTSSRIPYSGSKYGPGHPPPPPPPPSYSSNVRGPSSGPSKHSFLTKPVRFPSFFF